VLLFSVANVWYKPPAIFAVDGQGCLQI